MDRPVVHQQFPPLPPPPLDIVTDVHTASLQLQRIPPAAGSRKTLPEQSQHLTACGAHVLRSSIHPSRTNCACSQASLERPDARRPSLDPDARALRLARCRCELSAYDLRAVARPKCSVGLLTTPNKQTRN